MMNGTLVVGAAVLRRGLVAICPRSCCPGVTAQCMSTEAPKEKSVLPNIVPPPTPAPAPPSPPAPADTGIDDLLPASKTIADGWFNADPVKVTPACPSSRVSLFYGRAIPERPAPEVKKKEQTMENPEGLSKFLLGKRGNADGVQSLPKTPEGTTPEGAKPEQASAEPTQDTRQETIDGIIDDFTPGLYTENSSDKLTVSDVGKFYMFDRGLLPEAFPQYYKIEVPDDVPKLAPKGGCRTLTGTFKVSGRDAVLVRKSFHGLMNELSEDSGRIGKRLLIHGRPGSGKTFTLASLAEWGRKKQWLVMYIPSALAFGQDLIFTQRTNSHMYDTPSIAKDMLRSMRDNHREILEQEKQELDNTETGVENLSLGTKLIDLCEIGISAQLPSVSVDACLKLLREILFIKRSVPTMLIIDDYNGLYWRTDYGVWVNEKYRRMVGIEETVLGSFMRLLEKDTIEGLQGCIIGASTFSQGIRPNLWVPLGKEVSKNELDLLDRDEITGLLSNMWNSGAIRPMEHADIQKMIFLAGGNGHDLMRSLPILS